MKEQPQSISSQLTREEKLLLQTGKGMWNTADCGELRSVTFSDGPVGVRHGNKAVCFPSIAKLACSFDENVLREVGSAIGEQCRAEGVDVLLAPGINIKRNPRCGRNFEYFSEDPFLTAELANAYIAGVRSQQVGVCVKHFAANNQEYGRLVCDSIVDERALREIYLSAFERVIKKSKPCAVMCAYNKLNGVYCSENKRLLTDILRGEMGFDGTVISDWGAVSCRAEGLKAGLDLEMPQGDVSKVRAALESGDLNESFLDTAADNVAKLASGSFGTKRNVDCEYQHQLAGRISADTTVLAKNNCKLLPFSKADRIAVIGSFAKFPAFQGGGSSKVDAYEVEGLYDALKKRNIDFGYADGYDIDGNADESLIAEAQRVAETAEKVVLVVGVGSDTEGKDRQTLSLPEGQLKVIDAVTAANSNVAIVLQCGSVTDVAFAHSAKALLIDYYGGENDGQGLADVIFGDASPTGRLAETWGKLPEKLDSEFSRGYERALYKESVYVGYRYFTTANAHVDFPFGYGLSYNEITLSGADISKKEVKPTDKINVSLNVENKGKTSDAEVVQIYITNVDGRQFTAKKSLAAFKKIRLKAGESKKAVISVNVSDFACYDAEKGAFAVNGGKYVITVGRNANDDAFVFPITVVAENNTKDLSETFPCYYNVDENFAPTDEEFLNYCKTEICEESGFTASSPLDKLQANKIGKIVVKKLLKDVREEDVRTQFALPLRAFCPDRFSSEMMDTLLDMLNGKVKENIFKLYKQSKKFLKEKNAEKKKEKSK